MEKRQAAKDWRSDKANAMAAAEKGTFLD